MGGSMTASFGGQGMAPAGQQEDLIKDSDTRSFAQDVIEASKSTPVLVDFWAPWCGPCKQLTPILEKCVTEANGRVKLVKVNIDENQALAGQLRIQSIPAVFAFSNGQPVDGFMGALPESQVKQFIDRLPAGSEAGGLNTADLLDAAKSEMAAGNFEAAISLLVEIIQLDRGNVAAIGCLAKCQVELGDTDAAAATLDMIPDQDSQDADVVSARAALELALNASDDSEIAELSGKVDADPENYQARFDLAMALHASGRAEEAVDQLLFVVKADREWNEDAARKQLLTFFDAWGPADKRSIAGRRKLSAILFS